MTQKRLSLLYLFVGLGQVWEHLQCLSPKDEGEKKRTERYFCKQLCSSMELPHEVQETQADDLHYFKISLVA